MKTNSSCEFALDLTAACLEYPTGWVNLSPFAEIWQEESLIFAPLVRLTTCQILHKVWLCQIWRITIDARLISIAFILIVENVQLFPNSIEPIEQHW